MTNDANFVGSVPLFYDQGLGPNLFSFYARDISRRAAEGAPHRLLEIAAGTGIVTEQLVAILDKDTRITATDLNQAMLDIAQNKLGADAPVSFHVADATDLPFQNSMFDTLVCQFGIMFFPDKLGSLRHARRVLKPEGRYIFSVWCSWADNPFAHIVHETIAGFFEGAAPKFYETPFGYHDAAEISQTVTDAGFSHVDVETVDHEARLADIPAFAKALVYGNPVGAEIVDLGGDPEQVAAAIEQRLQETFGVTGTMPLKALVFTART